MGTTGITDTSYATIASPILYATGKGAIGPGDQPPGTRRYVYEATSGPNPYLEFFDSVQVNHSFLPLDDGVHEPPQQQQLFSTGLALIDGYCRDAAGARARAQPTRYAGWRIGPRTCNTST